MGSHISVIVTGSRDAANADALRKALTRLRGIASDFGLFVGCARGADQIAREWFLETHPQTIRSSPEPMLEQFVIGTAELTFSAMCVYYADWRGDGKAAGPIRNSRMIAAWERTAGDHRAIALWDGKSRGTLDAMTKIVRAGHGVEVIPA
jgi:hypothetical protein